MQHSQNGVLQKPALWVAIFKVPSVDLQKQVDMDHNFKRVKRIIYKKSALWIAIFKVPNLDLQKGEADHLQKVCFMDRHFTLLTPTLV